MRAGFFCILSLCLGLALPSRNALSNGALCLLDSTEIHIKNNLTAIVKVHRAFEISSEAGIRFAQVLVPINDYVEVRDIKGYTELPGGARIKLTSQDIGTSSQPAFKGFGDTQVVTFSLRTPVVGSRIYYEYKQIVRSLLYLPRITRVPDYPTNRLVVNLRWDKKVVIRYCGMGFEEFRGERSVKFLATGLEELPDEPYSCPDPLYLAITSNSFTYNRVKYQSESWADVGQFFARLAMQPEEFHNELKALAARLTLNAATRQDSISALFRFLADSVSYVAIEVGKGDFTPHVCSAILNRRFGDCKDQSVLLSSLCRAAGFDAYPALVSTSGYPAVADNQPWPSWFDHVMTVVKDEHGYRLLDPSDPLAAIDILPPRLRGKIYLVCDGVSGLKSTPQGHNPASTIIWQFFLSQGLDHALDVDFSVRYVADAAKAYRPVWQGKSAGEASSIMQSQLRYTGWRLSSFELGKIEHYEDTLAVSGSFDLHLYEPANSQNLAIASPLNAYLLDNIFVDSRAGDYCGAGSVKLEENVIVDLDIPGLSVGPEFSDSWRRSGQYFLDEMLIEVGKAIYHRQYDFSGNSIAASDYNSFRDFLLSRIDQQYVRLQK